MNDNFKDIAELLPEGLSESAITEICTLVDTVIMEQVDKKMSALETKVSGFIRLKIDELKEHAMHELNEENEVFHNSRMYEQIKALMTVELTEEDDNTALASIMKESHEVAEERDLVIDQYNKSLLENETLQNNLKVLSDRLEKMDNDKTNMETKITELTENKEKPFKSSEQAKMITADVDQPPQRTVENDNEFLTEEVMKFMPFNS